jgi:hypothetical protein
LPGAGVDLARHQERDQLLGQVVEVDVAVDEVVLVAAVAVPDEVGVVLEDRELPGDALLADLLLRVVLELLEDPLAGLVVDDELAGRGALGRRVLGMAAGVLVEAGAVLEEDVQEVLGGDQLLEEEADRLLDRQRLPPLGREDDPVLGLDAVDALLHESTSAGSLWSAENSLNSSAEARRNLRPRTLAIERAHLEAPGGMEPPPLEAGDQRGDAQPDRIPQGHALR